MCSFSYYFMIYRPAFCPETVRENDLGTISGSCTVTLINLHGTSYRDMEREDREILGTDESECLNNHQMLKNHNLNYKDLHEEHSGTIRNREEHSGRTMRNIQELSGTMRNIQGQCRTVSVCFILGIKRQNTLILQHRSSCK